jgi:crotonobetainyl-CoA:carnitine CoA-transferase CaiB-like acyl-CoA transferase
MPLPLDGTRVLDLAGAIGAYCTRLLADLGADVTKVEPPSGDRMRYEPPFAAEAEPGEASLVFAAYHANKRGVTLDVSRPEAEPLMAGLAESADVVVLSPSARAPVAGFDRDAKTATWRPCGLLAAITPFGLDGPWRDLRATPMVSFALGGGMFRSGVLGSPPPSLPGQGAWDEAGLHAATAIVSALMGDREGPVLIEVSAHEVATRRDYHFERYDREGATPWTRYVGVGVPPTGTWECADGFVDIAAHQVHHWDAFLATLDHPDELKEAALADAVVRRALHDGLTEVITRLLRSRSRLEILERGQRAGLPCSLANSPDDFARDPQAIWRDLFATTGAGADRRVFPWRWHRSDPDLIALRRPSPRLGEHNKEIYRGELGYSAAQLAAWQEAGLV